MYLLQQPDKLESLALNTLAAWIALQGKKFVTPIWDLRLLVNPGEAEEALSRQIDIIQNYLFYNLPRKFHTALLTQTKQGLLHLAKGPMHEIIECSKYELIVQWRKHVFDRMLQLFFTEDMTSLSFDTTNCNIGLNKILNCLHSKSHALASLVHLDLNIRLSMLTNMLEHKLICLLENLHSIKYLTLKNVCTDSVLLCVGNNCKLIEELDVSSSINVKDVSLNILKELRHLRRINLEKTSVSLNGIETLLLSCQKIEFIAMPSTQVGDDDKNRMSYVLQQIADSPEKFPKLFKLTSYRSYRDTLEELKLVVLMCPLIRNLSVSAAYRQRRRQADNLTAITALRGLRELSLISYNYYDDGVRAVLQVIGCNLVNLRLLRVKDIDLKALIDISKMCPNLQSLSLVHCDPLRTSTQCPKELENQPFRYLKHLILDMSVSFSFDNQHYSDRLLFLFRGHNYVASATPPPPTLKHNATQDMVSFLISNCLNVEFIQLSLSAWLTEALMLRILDENPLTYLKELKILQKRYQHNLITTRILTPAVIDRIVQNCVNRPQVIVEVVNDSDDPAFL